ncbi:MAG: hypothetical protein QG632_155 [Candidatus Dependentiae bacterium]|nr:hypothetical protein [Candidatus Dependentiae bacterium]
MAGLLTLANLSATPPYQTYHDDYIAKAVLVTALSGVFGAPLVTQATTTKAAVLSSANTLATFIDTLEDPIPDELVMLQTGFQFLLSICDDDIIIGNLHASLATALYALAAIDISRPTNTNAATISTQVAALTTVLSSYQTVHALGCGGDGGITNSAQWAIFLTDYARAAIAFSASAPTGIVQKLVNFSATNTTLESALADVPSTSDDTIVDYDTNYTETQAAVIVAANNVIANLTAITTRLALLTNSNQATEADQIDYIADSSIALQAKIDQFTANTIAIKNKATLGTSDIALRVLQRQLLFDTTTYAQKQTLINSIVTSLTGNSTAAMNVQAAVSDVGALLSITPPSFNCGPVTPTSSPSDALSTMQAEVDGQVTTYLNNLTTTIRGLFASPPNQDTLNAALQTLTPAIYIQMVANVMLSWLTQRIADLEADDIISLSNTTISKYVAEWNALRAILASSDAAGNALISNAALARIATAEVDTNYGNLFTSLPGSGAGEAFTLRARTLLKLPSGSVPVIKTQGINEFQRLAVQVIVAIQDGSLTAPATTTTNASVTTPSPLTVPGSPSATISDTSIMTSQLDDGDEILITGSGTLGTRLRDPIFASSISDKLSAAVKIFMNQSARIGLGTANISTHPGNTLNVLGGSEASGSTSVQIIPDGNCFLDINSDLIIGGSKPIIPTPNFGTDVHQITFYSAVPRTITVTANTTWDLSDFGSTGSGYIDYGKQIVFAGQVRLVLEPGAKIRFPHVDPSNIAQTVVLYFDDQASIVFQGDPLIIGKPWTDSGIAGTDCKRSKILGMGQIWLNKTSKMIINKPALVGIEADYTTPKTDITLSLQRNAQILIGTNSTAGGALQIGNMYDGGSSANPEAADEDPYFPNSPVHAEFSPNITSVDFTLTVNGDQPLFQIGRQGFFGIAAGVINKDGAPSSTPQAPNGVSGVPHSAWQLQRLYNVGNVTLNITQGIFDHSIITDGSSGDCSMLAVSKPANQFPASKYIIKVGPNEKGVIHGGGNVYFVDKDASMVLDGSGAVTASPHTVSIGSTAETLSFTLSNSGTYAPLAPSIAIKSRFYNIPTITTYSLYGRGIVQSNNSIPYIFAGPAEEFFSAITLNNYSDYSERYVPMSIMNTIPMLTYINSGTIIRIPLIASRLKDGTSDQASGLGYIRGSKQISGAPSCFYLPTE